MNSGGCWNVRPDTGSGHTGSGSRFGFRFGFCCRQYLVSRYELSTSKRRRREAALWQRRYWEHLIRDDADLTRHVNYIHWNPVKHGLVRKAIDWPYSTFHRYLHKGVYTPDWGLTERADDAYYGE